MESIAGASLTAVAAGRNVARTESNLHAQPAGEYFGNHGLEEAG
jgi:hypothetical protein